MYSFFFFYILVSCLSGVTLANNQKHVNLELPCKEVKLRNYNGSPGYSIDNVTLKNAKLNWNSAGQLTYFKTHIAIQGDGYLIIRLMDQRSFDYSDVIFNIDIGFTVNMTRLDIKSQGKWTHEVLNVQSPGILSATEFRTFYIKIDDGKLQFGKEGDVPIISHNDDLLKSVKYFEFFDCDYNEATFRYDCPAPAEELPCKGVLLNKTGWSMADDNLIAVPFSMDNNNLTHVTVNRSSTGQLTYLEMHFTVLANRKVRIYLMKEDDLDHTYFNINVGAAIARASTQLDICEDNTHCRTAKDINYSLDLLSPKEFREFYIKIDDGKLQFGKDGDVGPIISHDDYRLSELNYFQFKSYIKVYSLHPAIAKFRHDCPAPKELPCKEVSLPRKGGSLNHFSPTYSMDNDNFKHVTVKRNSADQLTYFEIHFAIQADHYVRILLMSEHDYLESDTFIDIDFGNKYGEKIADSSINSIHTPSILSPTEFRAFYIKIDDGTLHFGKEGDSSPLMSFNDDRLSEVNYFGFNYFSGKEAKIRFDCPAAVKGSE